MSEIKKKKLKSAEKQGKLNVYLYKTEIMILNNFIL